MKSFERQAYVRSSAIKSGYWQYYWEYGYTYAARTYHYLNELHKQIIRQKNVSDIKIIQASVHAYPLKYHLTLLKHLFVKLFQAHPVRYLSLVKLIRPPLRLLS